VKGTVLLNTPYFNRGSAHTAEEREEFGLTGLLPESIQTLEQQIKRAYEQYSTRKDDLSKNTFLTSLKEQNAVLYFRVSFRVPVLPCCHALRVFASPARYSTTRR
jgi:malate dehydrogenase (oxaloacetate-decarboxylating)